MDSIDYQMSDTSNKHVDIIFTAHNAYIE